MPQKSQLIAQRLRSSLHQSLEEVIGRQFRLDVLFSFTGKHQSIYCRKESETASLFF
jgi:hypothetical protein